LLNPVTKSHQLLHIGLWMHWQWARHGLDVVYASTGSQIPLT
jgi:hypothetical protein